MPGPALEAEFEKFGRLIDASCKPWWRAYNQTKHLPFEEAARERRRLCDLYEAQMRAEKGRAA
jgi:hypothetical protein